MGKAGKYNKRNYKTRERVRVVTDFMRDNKDVFRLAEVGRRYNIPCIQQKSGGVSYFSTDEAEKLEEFFRELGRKIADAGFMEERECISSQVKKVIKASKEKLEYVSVI